MNKKLSAKEAIQALKVRKDESISIAEAVMVKSEADVSEAINHIAVATAIIKDNLEKRNKVVPKLHEAHRAAVAMFDSITVPLRKAIDIMNKKISDYQIAERHRIQEANRKRIAVADAKEAAKQERLNKRADDLDKQGRSDEAEAKRDEAEMAITPAPEIETVEKTRKTDAGTLTITYDKKGQVLDIKAVISGILDGQLPANLVDINAKSLANYIKAFDPKVGEVIHGIKIIEVPRSTFRGAK